MRRSKPPGGRLRAGSPPHLRMDGISRRLVLLLGASTGLRGGDTTLAQLIVAVRAKAKSLESSAVTQEEFQSFLACLNYRPVTPTTSSRGYCLRPRGMRGTHGCFLARRPGNYRHEKHVEFGKGQNGYRHEISQGRRKFEPVPILRTDVFRGCVRHITTAGRVVCFFDRGASRRLWRRLCLRLVCLRRARISSLLVGE
jgi:hypothetical protein